mgnify:CR=1 FL=1
MQTIHMISRRSFLASATAFPLLLSTAGTVRSAGLPLVTVTKDTNCGCCGAWVEHIEAAGFPVSVVESSEVESLKQRLGVPVAAVVDTNCDPEGITFVVPGNDDASRAISLYCDLIARAAIDGISRAQGGMGVDIGAAEKPIVEELPSTTEDKGLGFEPLPGPRGVADDLKKLTGVSPAIEKKLNDIGIFHYSQIAELSPDAAHNVGEEVGLPGRVQGWVNKAKELTAE